MKQRRHGFLVIATLGLLVAGCATVYTSPDIVVSPPSIQGAKWTIGGKFDQTGFGSSEPITVTVYINGAAAATGPWQFNAPTNLNGAYQGHAIQSVCAPTEVPQRESCQVYIDGTQAATIYF